MKIGSPEMVALFFIASDLNFGDNLGTIWEQFSHTLTMFNTNKISKQARKKKMFSLPIAAVF